MVEAVIGIVWLALGGWAFGYWTRHPASDEQPMPLEGWLILFLIFAVIGPFMAGWALQDKWSRKARELAEGK